MQQHHRRAVARRDIPARQRHPVVGQERCVLLGETAIGRRHRPQARSRQIEHAVPTSCGANEPRATDHERAESTDEAENTGHALRRQAGRCQVEYPMVAPTDLPTVPNPTIAADWRDVAARPSVMTTPQMPERRAAERLAKAENHRVRRCSPFRARRDCRTRRMKTRREAIFSALPSSTPDRCHRAPECVSCGQRGADAKVLSWDLFLCQSTPPSGAISCDEIRQRDHAAHVDAESHEDDAPNCRRDRSRTATTAPQGGAVVMSGWCRARRPLLACDVRGLLVVAVVAVATGVIHDRNHGAFSRSARINRIAGWTSDLRHWRP